MKSECLLGRCFVCGVWNVSFLPGVASFRLQEIFFVDITHDVCCKVLHYEQRLHRHRNSSRIWADERHSEQQSWVVRQSFGISTRSNILALQLDDVISKSRVKFFCFQRKAGFSPWCCHIQASKQKAGRDVNLKKTWR